MKVHYNEGVATHIGPESCGARREACVEALTGERIGQPLSRESYASGCRRRRDSGRQHGGGRHREPPADPARSETLACAHAPCAGTGRSRGRPQADAVWSASGRRGAVADDARTREVGPCHSVCLTADASGGLKSHSARGPGLISEGGGNASPAREDGKVWRG